jgi:hypothetical protein
LANAGDSCEIVAHERATCASNAGCCKPAGRPEDRDR